MLSQLTSELTFLRILGCPILYTSAYLWSKKDECLDVLYKVPFPDTPLIGAGCEGQKPPNTDTARHPQFIMLTQVMPVPAHLFT